MWTPLRPGDPRRARVRAAGGSSSRSTRGAPWPRGGGAGGAGTFSTPQRERWAQGPSRAPLWAALRFAPAQGTPGCLSHRSGASRACLLPPVPPPDVGCWRPRGRLLLLCCSWSSRSGFLLWRRGSVNDRKVRPGTVLEEAFPEESQTKIPLSRRRVFQGLDVFVPLACAPRHLAPARLACVPVGSQPCPPLCHLVSTLICAQKGLFHSKIWLLLVTG